MPAQVRIAVFGGREIKPEIYAQARELGQLMAKEGWLVYCGGGPGVMEAVCRGVNEKGGTSIGILKGKERGEANPYVTIPVATNMGISRNALLAYNCDVAVAINGGYGTLSEIAYAAQMGVPVIGLSAWAIEHVTPARDPRDVIHKIKEHLE